MAAQTGGSVTLTGTSSPIQLRGTRMSAHGFNIFGVRAVLGRTFTPDEEQPGKNRVVVLSHSPWESQFGSDVRLIGRTIRLDGEAHVVIGVLPKESAFDRAFAQLFRPLVFEPQNMTRNFHWFGAMALLKPGVSLETSRAEMDSIGAWIAQDYPDSNKDWGVGVDRLSETIVGKQLRKSLYVLLAAVGMVLLIGCANLANLTLARSTARERKSQFGRRWERAAGGWSSSFSQSTAGLKAVIPPFTLPAEANITLDSSGLFAMALSVFTGLGFRTSTRLSGHATRTGGQHERRGPRFGHRNSKASAPHRAGCDRSSPCVSPADRVWITDPELL